MKALFKAALLAVAGMMLAAGGAQAQKPLLIAEQGSFAAGGTVLQQPGEWDYEKPLAGGQTLHGDHAYVFYQKPVKAHKYPLVFLHGAGQSARTWETTPDGREGFQNIFLRKGYSVYLADQPRRGRAGNSTVDGDGRAAPMDQLWYSNFRIGNYPDYFDGVQFPRDAASREQFFRQMTPNTGAFDENVVSDALAAVFDKIGDGVLVTHSQGGGPGWLTAIKNSRVKGVAAFEPGGGFIFPAGEVPEPMETSSPFGALRGVPVPLEQFELLTRIPIVIYYGDNIPQERTEEWNKDNWRVRLAMARLWVEAVNRHGGRAELVHLPEIGIYGNTHFPFADLNNQQIAGLLDAWLHKNKLI